MDTTVAADLDAYRTAASHLGGAGTAVPRVAVPDLGHAGAEAAAGRFFAALGSYHEQLGQAAGEGAASLGRLVTNLDQAGNG